MHPGVRGVRGPVELLFLEDVPQFDAVRAWPLDQAKLPPGAAEWVAGALSPTGQAICLRPTSEGQPLVLQFPETLRQGSTSAWMMAVLLRVEKAQAGGQAVELQVVRPQQPPIDRGLANSIILDDRYHLYYPEAVQREHIPKEGSTHTVTVRAASGAKAVYVAAVYFLPIASNHWPGELKIADEEYSNLHVSPDGRRLWAIWQQSVVSWNLADHRITKNVLTDQQFSVFCSPAGFESSRCWQRSGLGWYHWRTLIRPRAGRYEQSLAPRTRRGHQLTSDRSDQHLSGRRYKSRATLPSSAG